MLTQGNSPKKKILFYGRFPPPFTGETIGTSLVHSTFMKHHEVTKIEAIKMDRTLQTSRLRLGGAYLGSLITCLLSLLTKSHDYLYFVPGSSISGYFRDLAIIGFARIRKVQVIIHIRSGKYHQLFDKTYLPLKAQYLKGLSKIIALSEFLSLPFKNIVDPNIITVVSNTIDEEIVFNDSEISRKISERKNRKSLSVIYVSNMIKSKGYLDLTHAVAAIPDEYNINLTLIGSWMRSTDKYDFMSLIEQLPSPKRFNLLSPIKDRRELKEIYSNADVFVLPTYYPVEAQPRSILEALNSGTPVISTNHASIPEVIEHGLNGLLVQKKNPEDIAQAIIQMWDVKKWERFALAARESYLSKFSRDVINHQLLATIG
ncbi:MAG: glycosyltransferase family 4 protein [Candidatus Marinimicrobia bacterium]|nr:glycosyltransferase family 4 protein [Candidatus Neomarinimicrobiota bacterium]MCF7850186.1 glycosyltransferase family 4 protein [Candidatus Neomarinimicrobiota bacterium]